MSLIGFLHRQRFIVGPLSKLGLLRPDTPTGRFRFQPQARAGYHTAIKAAVLAVGGYHVRNCVNAGRRLAKKPPANARGSACPFSSGTKVTTVLWRIVEVDDDGPTLGIE